MYASPRQLAAGDLFAGYRIESLAGRGGMGLVYKARQLRPERMVAVKVIMPELAGDSDFRARFEAEATLAAQIEHPNVIPIYGVGDEDGLLYIVMRFVQSRDLGALLRSHTRLAPPDAAVIVTQIAAALDAAHAHGLVHRDVKPANVLVTGSGPAGHLYLTDFGLTKRVTDGGGLTAPGGFVGTLDYIAPEQVSGAPVDARVDVYALGCVLYHLLTGVVPFPRDHDAAKIFAHVSMPPPRPSRVAPALSLELDAVVARAMAKDPGARFQSAGELALAATAAAGPVASAALSIGGSPARGSAAPSLAGALIERDRELARLGQAVAAAVAGAGGIVAVEGEAGIGKTSLLDQAGRLAAGAGMRVISARGGELERNFAYGVVRQLFEGPLAAAEPAERARWLAGAAGLASTVLSVMTPLQGTGPDPSPILHGLYWLSANLAVGQPLMLVVDDAQWADDASIAFLAYLARRVDELAVLIVYASRAGEGASEKLPAVADPGLVASVLRPAILSRSATFELIEALLGRPSSPRFARACHVATAGNPFLLRELLRALEADGIRPEDASTSRIEQVIPRTIARATLTRLRRLGPAANQLAFAVAILGKSAELRDAAALAGLEEADEAARAADRLAAAAILHDSRPLEFIHPIVRTSVYEGLAPGRRAAGHKRAAQLLAGDGAPDAAIAPHLLATEPSGDPWVAERLSAAARAVFERGAPEAACTYLERAKREPPPPSDRLALLFALGSAELTVGRPSALGHLREVLEQAGDAQTRFAAAQDLVLALAYSGRMDEAVKLGTEVLSGISGDDHELRLRLEGELVALAQFSLRHSKTALDRLECHADVVRGDSEGERVILACLAWRAAHRGDSAPATARLARLALAGGKLLHEHRPGEGLVFLAVWALLYADEFAEAERYCDLAISEARRRGSAAALSAALACRCQILVRQGRLAEAESEALGVLGANQRHAIARPLVLSCLLQTMVERSDPRDWDAFLAEHELDGEPWEAPVAALLLFSRGLLRLAAGEPRAALHDFERMRARAEVSGLDPPALPVRACQALAHAQLGDIEAARDLADAELVRARRWGTPTALAFALRAAGSVAGGPAGIALLRESVAALAQSPAVYDRARSLTALGTALLRAGAPLDAQGPLRQAASVADACGARRLAATARAELLASGERPPAAGAGGPAAPTPDAPRIDELAATGLNDLRSPSPVRVPPRRT